MIPIRDTQPSSTRPIATYIFIAINTFVFLLQLGAGLNNEHVLYTYGLVPAKYTIDSVSAYFSFSNHIFSLFSYMFLHGGFLHFAGNMLFLFVFGDNVEDYLGHFRYSVFFILCGLISGLFHFALSPLSRVPTIGASGAIAGIMGAYFLLYPRSKILTIIPIIIIPFFIEIPAFIFLGGWFLIQFYNVAGQEGASQIAWWAHIGGFMAGMALIRLNRYLPETSQGRRLEKYTQKKTTPKFQIIKVKSKESSYDRYGTIEVSSIEAIAGTQKIVNIPWGFYKRFYRVNIPPGVKPGTKLKLSGLGKLKPDSTKGNLYLKVDIKNIILKNI
ncbi:MAG: rhomboid family intramembrane serine protease [Desulfobacteraceae bacterium]|nr:rhomboid family intramembrane serine protease [Desulfobacteraceae bacterium]